MLERWFAKFNPREATVIAFGNDAELWVPLVRLHDEQHISKLIVLGDPPCLKSAAQLAAGNVEICVLGTGSSMEALVDAIGSQSSVSGLDLEDLHVTFVDFDINPRSKQLVLHSTGYHKHVIIAMPPCACIRLLELEPYPRCKLDIILHCRPWRASEA